VLTNGTERAVYLDASGLVKLVVPERESADLERYLRGWSRRVSSALARTEVVRAVRPQGAAVVAQARAMLRDVDLIQVGDALLDAAADLNPPVLRSLDAIHIATALSLRGDLARIVTYDDRMASAARALGIAVDAPGR
jgi:predicted nucleic acid-binding protein